MRKTVCLSCTMFCNPNCKCKYCKETQCFAISPDRCMFAYPRIVMSKPQYNVPVDNVYNLENVSIPAEHEEGNVDRYEGIKILYKRNGGVKMKHFLNLLLREDEIVEIDDKSNPEGVKITLHSRGMTASRWIPWFEIKESDLPEAIISYHLRQLRETIESIKNF